MFTLFLQWLLYMQAYWFQWLLATAVLIASSCYDVTDATASVATSGCFADLSLSRNFAMPGLNFDPSNIDVDSCRYTCAMQDHR